MSHLFVSTVIFLAGAMSTGFARAAGGEVGNGGDTVLCSASTTNSLNGYYNLDYVLTTNPAMPMNGLQDIKTLSASVKRLKTLLEKLSPEMSWSYKNFSDDLLNEKDYSKSHIWIQASNGLVDLKDENMLALVPKNCQMTNTESAPSILQTVIRQKQGDKTLYYYSPEIVLGLLPELQKSFLYVHEWLWSHTQNPEVIRRVNHYLHSKALEQATPESFQQTVLAMGLDFRKPAAAPLCSLDPLYRTAIEQSSGLACDHFSNWAGFLELDLSKRNISFLPFGQINLLYGLERVAANNNQLTSVFPSFFGNLKKLKTVDFGSNQILQLPNGLFFELYQLEKVSFAANKLSEIPSGLWRDNPKLKILDLGNNQITNLPKDAFAISKSHQTEVSIQVNLANNQISEISENFAGVGPECRRLQLYLVGNPISKIAPNTFENIGKQCGFLRVHFDKNIPRELMTPSKCKTFNNPPVAYTCEYGK